MPERWQLVIGGKKTNSLSGRTFFVANPATGETVAEVAEAGPEDVDSAVRAANRAFREGPWGRSSAAERARVLFRVATLIRERAEELAVLETRQSGKPIADSRDDVAGAADCFEYYAGAATKVFGETIPVATPGLDFTLKEPLGVAALIVPWNFPVAIASWKLAPALAAGCTAVLKPASYTPLTALALGEIALAAGAPPGVVNVLAGPGAVVGGALAAHDLVAKIALTGETSTGQEILRTAAGTMKRVSLELGGKSPLIVFGDADLDRAAEKAPLSVFSMAGQDCCARTRCLVERRVHDDFLDRFVRKTRELRVGDPMDPSTQVGPLISRRQFESVSKYLSIGREEGARLVCGGTPPAGPALAKGAYMLPAVFDRVTDSMRIFQEEIFGPVITFTPFDDEEEAAELANATPYGLSGSIWTTDIGRALRTARRVKSGVLSVNSSRSVHIEAPFGGRKMSGIGRDLGMDALSNYLETKNVFVSLE
ncbi:MAG: aldehyde dehydrogenase [Planctomycetes bacterium]|nr:aldehyde dehydrogenase [Planctomycetota bacterium]